MQLATRITPNRTPRSHSSAKPIYLVLHQTVGAFDGAVSWLCNPAAKASADEVISRDGARVTVLNPTRDLCYSWQVGDANALCAAGIEGEWYQLDGKTYGFQDAFYHTIASRLVLRQKQAKQYLGVDIPLHLTTAKGHPGIVTHGQLAHWYGGSDHYSCGTAYDLDKLMAAVNAIVNPLVKVPAYIVSTPADGEAGRYRLKSRALLAASGLLNDHTHVNISRGSKLVPKERA